VVFWRKPKLPASKQPELEGGERVVAWSPAGEEAVVVTNRGLFLPGRPRLRWHEIHKATWSDGVLRIVPATGPAGEPDPGADYAVVTDATPVTIALRVPGDVPKRVRERVTASVAYTSKHPLPGGGAARVVGRRVSGRDGLSWFVRFEGAVDPADPEVAEATATLVAAARASISDPDL
jgi:hypothetical protein